MAIVNSQGYVERVGDKRNWWLVKEERIGLAKGLYTSSTSSYIGDLICGI